MTLREAREARGWTLNEAAKRAGVSRQGLHNLEAGRTPFADVKLGTALRILHLYWPDVSLTEALGHPVPPPNGHPPEETTLWKLVPRDRYAVAHMLAASTSSRRIERD